MPKQKQVHFTFWCSWTPDELGLWSRSNVQTLGFSKTIAVHEAPFSRSVMCMPSCSPLSCDCGSLFSTDCQDVTYGHASYLIQVPAMSPWNVYVFPRTVAKLLLPQATGRCRHSLTTKKGSSVPSFGWPCGLSPSTRLKAGRCDTTSFCFESICTQVACQHCAHFHVDAA